MITHASRRHVRRLISGAYGAQPHLQIVSRAGEVVYSPTEFQSECNECLMPIVKHGDVVLHDKQGPSGAWCSTGAIDGWSPARQKTAGRRQALRRLVAGSQAASWPSGSRRPSSPPA